MTLEELLSSAWFRCRECQAVFKLKHLIIRHLKTRHAFIESPNWELENNDDKCARWWERVKVDGKNVEPILLPSPIRSETATPTFSLQDDLQEARMVPECVKKFRCDLCTVEMWFAFKKSLYAHLLKNHDRGVSKIPGVNACRFCGVMCETPSHLKSHIRSHTGENEDETRLVECGARCGRVFSSKASMKKHMRFKCDEARRQGLEEVLSGSGDEDGGGGSKPRVPKTNPHVLRQSQTDLPFKCPQCVETFPTQARLQGHLTVHAGDLFRCRYCSAPFFHVHTRGAHETNAHNDELGFGYRCPICGKNFANIATMRGHYKYTHWMDLPPREEIEGWRIHTPDAIMSTDIVESETEIESSEHVQHVAETLQESIPLHHIQIPQQEDGTRLLTFEDGQQTDFHTMLGLQPGQQQIIVQVVQQPSSDLHLTSHSHSQPEQHILTFSQPQQQQQQQNMHLVTHHGHVAPITTTTSTTPTFGLKMGVGLPQVTMGALIGHVPYAQQQQHDSRSQTVTEVKGQKSSPFLASTSSSSTSPKKNSPSTSPTKGGPPAKKRKRGSDESTKKVERKKFHCRKPGCDGKFQRRWELTTHLERVHDEFSCEFCSAPSLLSKNALVAHQYSFHHRELGCYECRICSAELESPRGVQEHVSEVHPGSKVPLTLEAKMWRRGSIQRKRVQRPGIKPCSTNTNTSNGGGVIKQEPSL